MRSFSETLTSSVRRILGFEERVTTTHHQFQASSRKPPHQACQLSRSCSTKKIALAPEAKQDIAVLRGALRTEDSSLLAIPSQVHYILHCISTKHKLFLIAAAFASF
jgi:hypothetical protein